MKYVIRAESEGIIRDEIINVKTNVLFKGCKNYNDVANAYHAFWNCLNDHSPKVTILGVLPLGCKVKKFKGDAVITVKVVK